jgi:hypothetical protein
MKCKIKEYCLQEFTVELDKKNKLMYNCIIQHNCKTKDHGKEIDLNQELGLECDQIQIHKCHKSITSLFRQFLRVDFKMNLKIIILIRIHP